jgi:hypothetical protein
LYGWALLLLFGCVGGHPHTQIPPNPGVTQKESDVFIRSDPVSALKRLIDFFLRRVKQHKLTKNTDHNKDNFSTQQRYTLSFRTCLKPHHHKKDHPARQTGQLCFDDELKSQS